jgi:hypothetical protein
VSSKALFQSISSFHRMSKATAEVQATTPMRCKSLEIEDIRRSKSVAKSPHTPRQTLTSSHNRAW